MACLFAYFSNIDLADKIPSASFERGVPKGPFRFKFVMRKLKYGRTNKISREVLNKVSYKHNYYEFK